MTAVRMSELTWPQYAERVGQDVILLPVGSTEQHGYHLPLGTDVYQVVGVSEEVAHQVGGIMAPPVTYGYKSNPRSGGGEIFCGTTSLSAEGLIRVTRDVLGALVRDGAKKIVVMDGHYENNSFLHEAIDQVMAQAPDDVRMLKCLFIEFLSQETLDDIFPGGFPGFALEHAALLETSLMMYLHPDLVHMERQPQEEEPGLPDYDIYPQPEDLVPASGALADPSPASAAIGERIFTESVAGVVEMINEAF